MGRAQPRRTTTPYEDRKAISCYALNVNNIAFRTLVLLARRRLISSQQTMYSYWYSHAFEFEWYDRSSSPVLPKCSQETDDINVDCDAAPDDNPIFGFPIPVFRIQYASFTELSLTIRGVSYSLPCKMIALFGPLKFFFLGGGQRKGRFDPLGKSTPKEHTHHRNTFLDALSENPRFSG